MSDVENQRYEARATRSVRQKEAEPCERDETKRDAGEPELGFRKKRMVWVKKSDGLKGVRAGPWTCEFAGSVVTRMLVGVN